MLKVSKLQSERERASRIWKALVDFDLYTSFLLQTCFIVFVTYFLHLKHPNKFIFNVINIYIGHLFTTLFSLVLYKIFKSTKTKMRFLKKICLRIVGAFLVMAC